MSVVAIAQHRASGGRFAPGRSGNPAGRPKGARNKTTLLVEAVLEESGETLVQKAVAGALGGDGATLRFLLGRLLSPASGDQPVALDLAPGEESDPAAVLGNAIRAMAEGEITPKQALQIGRVLAILAKLKRMSSPPPAKRPVSKTPLPLAQAGGGGARVSGKVRGTAERSESALTPPLSRKGEREAALGGPVFRPVFFARSREIEASSPQPSPAGRGGNSGRTLPRVRGGQGGGIAASVGEAPV